MTNRRSPAATPVTPESKPAQADDERAFTRSSAQEGTQPTNTTSAQMETAQIDQVAARTGLTKRALRYYEEIGLLDRPNRTVGNYRQYTERDIARLESIKRWRELLGFSLSEIRELVSMDEERQHTRNEWPLASDARHRLNLLDHSDELARRTLQVVEEKIAGLEEMRSELRERLERHERMRAELQAELAATAEYAANGHGATESGVQATQRPPHEAANGH